MFLERFPFGPANPPKAALVLETSPGATDVVVMELTDPTYDAATHTATYAAKVLSDYQQLGITFQQEPKGRDELRPEFGAASLYLDDCPDIQQCFAFGFAAVGPVPGAPIEICWNPWQGLCLPCNGWSYELYDQLCNATYSKCSQSCVVYS